MKLHILSDIHIEFGHFEIPETDADVIIIAGDVAEGKEGLNWILAHNIKKPIIYVPGNHEYYNHDIALIHDLKFYAKHLGNNVHVLDNDFIDIDGVRFIGSTLWTDFELFSAEEQWFSIDAAKRGMWDFRCITDNGGRFTPQRSIEIHKQSIDFINFAIEESKANKNIVITHHTPSWKSVADMYVNDYMTAAFTSDLSYMMDGDRIALWIHGHTHDSYDYELRGTRVVCNPRGYAKYKEQTGFDPYKTVEI